ncbi:porin [Methylovirgula sp. 4M-Z18]|uniref:porin n=3 Tax=Methylovirgula sp. 4M-Z18 TaxID=2293567 RepID=UPI0030D42DBD
MKLVKSLLLASAAGLAAAASAQAADLPSKKAAPAEYVKVCSAHGEGFFYIPGTDTCLKISGHVRLDYQFESTGNVANYQQFRAFQAANAVTPGSGKQFNYSGRAQNQTGFTVRARTQFDARTTTAYGTLRSFASLDWKSVTGANPLEYGNGTSIDKAFIQWAGITAGRAQSMFDYYADSLGYDDVRGPDHTVNLLAYTATFGGGFAATLSLEDTNQTGTIGSYTRATTAGGTPTVNSWGLQGTRQPDVVAAIGVEQGWGGAQLSGLYHSINVESGTAISARHKEEAGWGANAGVHIKLPMIAPGDELWLQATYTKGDLALQTQGYPRGWNLSNVSGGITKGWVLPDYDAVIVNGSDKLPTAWSAIAAFQHNWNAQWATHVEASYLNVKYPSAVTRAAVSSQLGATNWNEWRVGLGTDWKPVKNLLIGLELYYTRLDQKAPLNANGRAFTGAGTGVPFKKNINTYEGVFRIQRDF